MENFESPMEKLLKKKPFYQVDPSTRLSFDFNSSLTNTSFTSRTVKKRKLEEDEDKDQTAKSKTDGNESLNNSSIFSSSSWEAKILRADLLESQSRVAQLRKEIEHQNTIQANLEVKYSHKEKSLEQELEHFKNKTGELEKIVHKNRKKENASQQELSKAKTLLNTLKQKMDQKVYELQKNLHEIEQKHRKTINDLSNELGEQKRVNATMESRVETYEEETDTLHDIINDLRSEAEQNNDLKEQIETVQRNLRDAESKIKDLEYEVASYGDWKELSRASHTRMSGMSELDQEVTRLRAENKNLRDSIGNILLMEEQVHDLKSRCEKYEQTNVDAVGLQVQLKSMEVELNEWKQLGTDHCPKNSSNNPINLRSHIEQLLRKDVLLTNEKSNAKTEMSSAENQLLEMRNQNEISLKQIEAVKKTLKHYQMLVHRLQKKLSLVSSERECLKQLLDNYEKDLTITQNSANNPESQVRVRIDMLEKTLNGYKDLCGKMELELKEYKNNAELNEPAPESNSEQFDRMRKEMDIVRLDNEKLKKRKNELEIELENCLLRSSINGGDVDEMYRSRIKVMHMSTNPTSQAIENHANEVDKLKAEIERLRVKNRKLQEGNEELTVRVNETVNMTLNIQELGNLKSQISQLESKNQHLKDVYRSAMQQFRDVCYMLLGYRIDRIGNTMNYKVSSMYADSENEYLNFRLTDQGVVDMLESEYSDSLADMIGTHLSKYKSLPALLSTLTMQLIKRTTLTSICTVDVDDSEES